MNLKFKYTLITVTILTGLLMACGKNSGSDAVTVAGRQILVNNTPYLIKGICYHPVPKGSDTRDFSHLNEDLKLMKEAGINTIRVYEPIGEKAVLDEIHALGLKVIIGIGYNQDGRYDILSGSFIDYVNTYKDHGAILLWELGNEYNYHPEWFDGNMRNWYQAMNEAADEIHKTDPNHPVTTAHGDLPDSLALSLSPNIDVWGMNVYRWDNPASIFSEWEAISTKPMYLSEAGGDSYMTTEADGYTMGINETAQADANSNIIDAVFDAKTICSGVTIFQLLDGWWKAGNNNTHDPGGHAPNSSGVPYDGAPNEEHWGILDIDRNRKEAYEVVKQKYNVN
jgi:hypothetical protein